MPSGKPHPGAVNSRNNLLMFTIVGMVVLSIMLFPSGPSQPPAIPTFRYAMMFDGGSSGSRVHVYRFKVLPSGALEVESELFEQLKPGLSSFKDNPAAAAASLIPLLDVSKAHIPRHLWHCTPVALYATAGLRLLGKEPSDAILEEVRKLLRASPFVLPSDDHVAVIDGSREGLFGWMTVNYLLRHWPSGDEKASALLIDLGGGSTQIVFRPKGSAADAALVNAGHNFTASVAVDGDKSVLIYQHSHLGFGLNEANKALKAAGADQCAVVGAANGGSGTDAFARCRAAAKDYLMPSHVSCAHDVGCAIHGAFMPRLRQYFTSGEVYAISYINDRLESWLPPGEQPRVALRRVKEIAETIVCPPDAGYKSDVTGGNAQHCLDLAYIYSLLRDAYDVDDSVDLVIAKKIRGYETAWCLGASISLTNSFRMSASCAA